MSNWQDAPNAMTPGRWYTSRDLADRLDCDTSRVNEMVAAAVARGLVNRKPDGRKWLYTLAT